MVAAVAGLWVFMRARRMSVRRAVAVIRLRLCECSACRVCAHIFAASRIGIHRRGCMPMRDE